MLSFVKVIHAALHRKGYDVAVNADGLMNEYYDETPTGTDQLRASGTAWYQGWNSWQQLIGLAQSMGDDLIGLEKGSSTNTTSMTYGKASFLLEWNGGGSVFIYKRPRQRSDQPRLDDGHREAGSREIIRNPRPQRVNARASRHWPSFGLLGHRLDPTSDLAPRTSLGLDDHVRVTTQDRAHEPPAGYI
jgi:hypothetical protein